MGQRGSPERSGQAAASGFERQPVLLRLGARGALRPSLALLPACPPHSVGREGESLRPGGACSLDPSAPAALPLSWSGGRFGPKHGPKGRKAAARGQPSRDGKTAPTPTEASALAHQGFTFRGQPVTWREAPSRKCVLVPGWRVGAALVLRRASVTRGARGDLETDGPTPTRALFRTATRSLPCFRFCASLRLKGCLRASHGRTRKLTKLLLGSCVVLVTYRYLRLGKFPLDSSRLPRRSAVVSVPFSPLVLPFTSSFSSGPRGAGKWGGRTSEKLQLEEPPLPCARVRRSASVRGFP